MLDEHLSYLSDPVRIALYRECLGRVIRPGDRVADLGCGSGILGLLALGAGASRVHAIDNSAALGLAREAFHRAGLDDRVLFYPSRAQHAVLPERVDVAICDHVGYFGFDYGIVGLLADARKRLLKPGGTVVPAGLDLYVAPVQSERACALAHVARDPALPLEFRFIRDFAANTRHGILLSPEELLGSSQHLGTLDLRQDQPELHSWTVELKPERDGLLHGLAGWFDCALDEGARMTNSPLADLRIRRAQAFLPLGDAVAVARGEPIIATVMARPADDLISWCVECPGRGLKVRRSTWNALPLAPADLLRADPERRPVPSQHSNARSLLLGYCDGQRTAAQVVQSFLADHPHILPSREEILAFAAEVLARDTSG